MRDAARRDRGLESLAGLDDETLRSKLGLLAEDAASAGRAPVPEGVGFYYKSGAADKVQRALTRAREDARLEALKRDLDRLARDDPRRCWRQCVDRMSYQFLQAWPSAGRSMGNETWAYVASTYFGLPVPAYARCAGRRLDHVSGAPRLDEYGLALANNKHTMNLGNARVRWHDAMQRVVARTCRLAGFGFEENVAVHLCHKGLRGADVDAAIEKMMDCGDTAGRIIPDGRLRGAAICDGDAQDVDFKTLTARVTYAAPWPLKGDGEGRKPRPPVDTRAARVRGEYLRHAHRLDVAFNGVAEGDRTGPMEMLIKDRGTPLPLCFGTVGEACAEVHQLARECAEALGRDRFASGSLRTANEETAVALMTRQIYCDWGVAAVVHRARYFQSLLSSALDLGLQPTLLARADGDELDAFLCRANLTAHHREQPLRES